MLTKFLLIKKIVSNRIVQVFFLVLFLLAVGWAWSERLERKIEERLLLEIENKVLLEREKFRQDARTLNNEINRLTNDELRARAREWMQ